MRHMEVKSLKRELKKVDLHSFLMPLKPINTCLKGIFMIKLLIRLGIHFLYE
jgi:hypothetical protein